jgi:hypothetical protein
MGRQTSESSIYAARQEGQGSVRVFGPWDRTAPPMLLWSLMFRHSFSVFILFFGLLLQTTPAATIISTFGPGVGYIGGGIEIGSFDPAQAQFGLESQVAMNFTPSADFLLDSIDVAVAYIQGPNQMSIYLTSGALPSAPIESFSISGLTAYGPPTGGSIETLLSVQHPELFAGTQYWIVISAADLVNTEDVALQNNGGVLGVADLVAGQANWIYFTGDPTRDQTPAFDVVGSAVPEPGSEWLVGSSTLALLALRKVLKSDLWSSFSRDPDGL